MNGRSISYYSAHLSVCNTLPVNQTDSMEIIRRLQKPGLNACKSSRHSLNKPEEKRLTIRTISEPAVASVCGIKHICSERLGQRQTSGVEWDTDPRGILRGKCTVKWDSDDRFTTPCWVSYMKNRRHTTPKVLSGELFEICYASRLILWYTGVHPNIWLC